MDGFSEFHFLRPSWLLALVLLVPLVWIGIRSRRSGGAWRNLCDEHLLKHLITAGGGRVRHWPLALAATAWTTACIALAGPAWERLPQPAFRSPEQRVLVLNLSQSMNATDIEPSRLARARFELSDALDAIGDGQAGLVIFAEEPYVVTPISDDPHVVAEFVPVLETSLMPGRGTRVDRAIDEARTLLEQGGAVHGGIVLLTDSAGDRPEAAIAAARNAAEAGFEVSVLAIGTEAGAPIPGTGGFARNGIGRAPLARLDVDSLEAVARAGNGRFTRVTADDRDVEAVLQLGGAATDPTASFEATGFSADAWHDMGIAFVWLLALMAAFAFRRGWATTLALLVFAGAGTLSPSPAHADVQDWLQRPDQRAADAFEGGRHAEAAELFENPAWRAASLYRDGRYDEAAELLGESEDTTGRYNLGNSLARAGRLEDAIAAYDRVLEREPAHADAEFNRELVSKLLQEQQQEQQQSGESSDSDGESDSESQGSESSDAASGDESDEQGEQQPGESQGAPNGESESKPEAGESESSETDGSPESELAEREAEQGDTESQSGAPTDPETGEERPEPSSAMAGQPLSEREQAVEQWLGRVSDDPGGLLREKLRRKYARKRYQDSLDARRNR
jgi:Ca-activated chloride channel family protein